MRPSTLLILVLTLASPASCGGSCGGIQAPPSHRAHPRLASLTPSLTELAVHLGASDHLVGVAKHGPSVPGVPVVAGVHPNMEAVLFVEPDLVAIGRFPSTEPDIAKLRASNLKVLALPVVTLADLRESAVSLGQALGKEASARAFAKRLDGALAAATASRQSKQRLRILVIYGRSGGSFFSTGGGDHVDDILRALGAQNVAAGGPVSVKLSLERIIHLAPDTILHVIPEEGAVAFWREAAPTVPAVRRGRIIVWPDDSLALNGPRIVDAIATLATRLAALPPAPSVPAERP